MTDPTVVAYAAEKEIEREYMMKLSELVLRCEQVVRLSEDVRTLSMQHENKCWEKHATEPHLMTIRECMHVRANLDNAQAFAMIMAREGRKVLGTFSPREPEVTAPTSKAYAAVLDAQKDNDPIPSFLTSKLR